MMSLVPAIPDKDLSKHIPKSSEIAPLLVKFTNDCVPLSCISSTVSCLLSAYNWRLCRFKDESPECLSHNVVSLYTSGLPIQIVLVDAASHLEIHVCVEMDVDRQILSKACFQVREAVFAAVTDVFEVMQLAEIDISPAFLCPCCQDTETHSASFAQFETKCFLQCSKSGKSVSAQGTHDVWFGATSHRKKELTLPKLLQLKIHQNIGANYMDFGIFLLNDDDGSQMDSIEMECQGRPERIARKIFQE